MKNIFLLILVMFSACAFGQPDYIPADLERFEKTGNCPNCDLSSADLHSSHYRDAVATNALFVKSSLTYAAFTTSNFAGAIFTLADLSYSMFSGSNFTNANLSNTDLRHSNFSNCDFTSADLTKADLSYATLIRAKISAEQLKSARSFSCAVLPDGSIAPPASGSSCY